MASQPTIHRLCKKRSHDYDERFVNTNRERKSEGMRPELEKALLTWVNIMHAQRVNVSSEMIKEMGIRILDGVNEMLPAWYCVYDVDERNADDRAASRAIYRHQYELRKKLVGAYRQTRIESYFTK